MSILNYIFGPKLYMEYATSNMQKMYESSGIEKFGDSILSTFHLMWSVSYYTSPFIVTFLYRRGYLVADSLSALGKFATSIGIIIVISLCMRGFGRSQSRSYAKLVKALELSKSSKTAEEGKRALRMFDFEFRSWQVDFDVNSVQGGNEKKSSKTPVSGNRELRPSKLSALPCKMIAYAAIHTFGLSMIYPGSIKLLQSYMRPMLIAGRAKLIQEENAKRYKIKTIDDNEIDSIFIDNRANGTNGKTLVICSEGNAGFYEIGIMATPIALKYSVIGWNHPGFEGSTGKPFPDQDKNAIDSVIQFALQKLNFAVEDIILFGWSIGAFSTLWAASSYPDVKGVILDATFDDILPLAIPRMPASLSGIVRIAIRDYCNLNNAEMIPNYNGPMLLIRRTEDEIIAEDNRIDTNRGNYLALALLKYRYPNIFKVPQLTRIKKILSKPLDANNFTNTEDELCMSRLITYASDQGKMFPMHIGEDYSDEVCDQMAQFLLLKHFCDYKSTHCTPLPTNYFNIPWDIPIEHGFVFT